MAEMVILSVQKALQILNIIAFDDIDGTGVPLKKLGIIMNQRTTTLRNILKTMINCGYVSQNASGHYIAGSKLFELKQLGQILPGGGFYDAVQKQLTSLGKELGESLSFVSLLNGKRIPVFECNSENPVRVDVSYMESHSIYSVASGRVLAAFSDARSLENIIEQNGFPGEDWDGISEMTEFKQKLSEIRKARHAIACTNGDIVAIAVPLKIHPLSSIGYYSPSYRCDSEKQKLVLDRLWETAFRLEVLAETQIEI